MRVLHVITGLSSGGAESQLELLLRHRRHDAEVVALYNFGSVGRRIAAGGVRTYDLGMRSNRDLLVVPRLARLMRRGRYDVVHAHLYRACIYGRLAARLARVPVVVTTEHSLGDSQIEGRRKSRAVRSLYLATDRFSDATVAVSPRVRERLIDWGVPGAKIRVIPNGIDLQRFGFDGDARVAVRAEFGIPPDDFVVGALGRLHPLKRYDVLLRSAEPLLKRGAWLLLVGEGEDKPRLAALARAGPYPHRVVFAGEREDSSRLLSAMDVFVSPSREETFGLAVVEALAVGLRAVFAACPALDGVESCRARRFSGEATELRQILLGEYERGPRELVGDESVGRLYDARVVASSLEELYEALLSNARDLRADE